MMAATIAGVAENAFDSTVTRSAGAATRVAATSTANTSKRAGAGSRSVRPASWRVSRQKPSESRPVSWYSSNPATASMPASGDARRIAADTDEFSGSVPPARTRTRYDGKGPDVSNVPRARPRPSALAATAPGTVASNASVSSNASSSAR